VPSIGTFSMFKEGEHRCNTYKKRIIGYDSWKHKKLKVGRIYSYWWKKTKTKNHHEKLERKWWLDNICVLYNWTVGMFFFFKMCILLSEQPICFGSLTSLQSWKRPQDSCF